MEAFVYLDNEGNTHARGEWDFHHVFPRCKMKGRGEKDWANLNGLVLPIYKVWHNLGRNSLHAQVDLAPKPDKQLMLMIREHLYADPTENVYDRFLGVNSFIHDVADTTDNTGLQRIAARIADNLEQQSPFILQGMVTKVEVPDGIRV